jgi:hypothetical protein
MTNKKIVARRGKKDLSPPDRIMDLARSYGPGGRVFTLADFSGFGSNGSVHKALSRLVRAGKLHRICQGFYLWPNVRKKLKVPESPDPDAFVDAIARRDQVTILADNLVAAKDVGITDAVPDKTVYLTTGNPKTITIGKNTIKIKKATWPVAAVANNPPAARIVQALEWLGRRRALRADNLAEIGRLMSKQEYDALASSAADATCGARVARGAEASATNARAVATSGQRQERDGTSPPSRDFHFTILPSRVSARSACPSPSRQAGDVGAPRPHGSGRALRLHSPRRARNLDTTRLHRSDLCATAPASRTWHARRP